MEYLDWALSYVGGGYKSAISDLESIRFEANREIKLNDPESRKYWLKYELTSVNIFADCDEIVLTGTESEITDLLRLIANI